MNNKIMELSRDIISYSHENCEMWEEEHNTDLQALDNSHESYWIEFLENGIMNKDFTENQYFKAFNIAYNIVNKGVYNND